MSMSTVSWAIDRRYGNPLLRLTMLALAMESGGDPDMGTSFARLAEHTEIDIAFFPQILDRLVADGHLVSWRRVNDDVAAVVFHDEAFPDHHIIDDRPRPPTCPPSLRRRVIDAFGHACSYCKRPGDVKNGPDGTGWHVDRIVAGGAYEAGNVTLACRPCNSGKSNRPAPAGTLSLAQIEGAVAP